MFGAFSGGTMLVLPDRISGLVAVTVRSSYESNLPCRLFHTLRLLLLLWDAASIRWQRPSMTTSYLPQD